MCSFLLPSLNRLLTVLKAAFPQLDDYLNATVDPQNAFPDFEFDPSAELSGGNILPAQDAPTTQDTTPVEDAPTMHNSTVHAERGPGHWTLPLSKTEKTAIRKQRRADIDIFTEQDPAPISAVFHRMLKHAEYPIEHPPKGVHDDHSALLGDIPRIFAALFAVRDTLKDMEWPKSKKVRAHRLEQIEKYWAEQLNNQPLRHFSHGHVHYLFKHCLTNSFFPLGLAEPIMSPLVYEPYIWPDIMIVCEAVLCAYKSVLTVGVE